MTILVVVDQRDGELTAASREAITFARELGQATVDAVLLSSPSPTVTEALGNFGVERVTALSTLDDAPFAPKAIASAIGSLAAQTAPELVVATATSRNSEIVAHLAAQRDMALVTNVVAANATDGGWNLTRTRWGGVLFEDALLDTSTAILTVAPHHVGAAPAAQSVATTVDEWTDAPAASDLVGAVTDIEVATDGAGLATAPVVIAGGRGVGGADGFAVLEELAQLLGGAVGCSRVATNSGWRSHNDQVGQTGTRIAPDLYVACGISGATQHWVGCMAAKRILAINTDVEAPMVTRAHYAAIGDLHEILPAVVAEVRSRTGR